MVYFLAMSKFLKNTKLKFCRGFTLVEMLVSVGIFMILTSMVVYNYSDFNSNIIVTNVAYDVALALRQAQVYGLSVRGNTSVFSAGYGININKTKLSELVLFADLNNNGLYDQSDSKVETFSFPPNYRISDFCFGSDENTLACGSSLAVTDLAVVFERPNPDAIIKDSNGDSYGVAKITVTSPSGARSKSVFVYSTGQISVR